MSHGHRYHMKNAFTQKLNRSLCTKLYFDELDFLFPFCWNRCEIEKWNSFEFSVILTKRAKFSSLKIWNHDISSFSVRFDLPYSVSMMRINSIFNGKSFVFSQREEFALATFRSNSLKESKFGYQELSSLSNIVRPISIGKHPSNSMLYNVHCTCRTNFQKISITAGVSPQPFLLARSLDGGKTEKREREWPGKQSVNESEWCVQSI